MACRQQLDGLIEVAVRTVRRSAIVEADGAVLRQVVKIAGDPRVRVDVNARIVWLDDLDEAVVGIVEISR